MRTATGEQEQSERKKTCLQFTRVKHEPESVLIKSRRERDGKDNNNQRTVWEKKKTVHTLPCKLELFRVCERWEEKHVRHTRVHPQQTDLEPSVVMKFNLKRISLCFAE